MGRISSFVCRSLGTTRNSVATHKLVVKISTFSLLVVASLFTGCGSSKNTSTAPAQPTLPFAPAVPITWTPGTSSLPAPPAQVPPPAGSNDFPLTISSPTEGDTLTSPANVVASASPKNPIFFMRIYVDQLAVYFTFTNSINTQIFIA